LISKLAFSNKKGNDMGGNNKEKYLQRGILFN
jgi:hypothetical protein